MKPGVILAREFDPKERALVPPGHSREAESKQTTSGEDAFPASAQAVVHELGFGRRPGPSTRWGSSRTLEPVHQSANGLMAELTVGVGDAEVGSHFPNLGPLPTTHRRGQITAPGGDPLLLAK